MKNLIVCLVLIVMLVGGCSISTPSKQCGRSFIFPYEKMEIVEKQVPVSYIRGVEYKKCLSPDGTLCEIPILILKESDEKKTINAYVQKTIHPEVADVNGDNKTDVIYLREEDKLLYREKDFRLYASYFYAADNIFRSY